MCPREVEEKLAQIAADNPIVNMERQIVEVDREATTEEESDN